MNYLIPPPAAPPAAPPANLIRPHEVIDFPLISPTKLFSFRLNFVRFES